MWWECGVSRGWGQLDQGRGCDLLLSFLFAFLFFSRCTRLPLHLLSGVETGEQSQEWKVPLSC